MSMNIKELMSQVKEITASGLPFMEGKDKVELNHGDIFTVKNYGYLKSENGEFVVVADDITFAFGGSVVTDAFKQLDDKIMVNDIDELLKLGIPMKIGKKTSKTNKRGYTYCEFFPTESV